MYFLKGSIFLPDSNFLRGRPVRGAREGCTRGSALRDCGQQSLRRKQNLKAICIAQAMGKEKTRLLTLRLAAGRFTALLLQRAPSSADQRGSFTREI